MRFMLGLACGALVAGCAADGDAIDGESDRYIVSRESTSLSNGTRTEYETAILERF
jgi:hypothetical protein